MAHVITTYGGGELFTLSLMPLLPCLKQIAQEWLCPHPNWADGGVRVCGYAHVFKNQLTRRS
jgi:hypothetical protein